MEQSSTTGERSGLAGQASSKVQDAAGVAHEKASDLTDQGRSRLSQELDERTEQYASQARSFAEALRRTGNEMQTQGNGAGGAKYVRQVASHVERLGSYLEQKSGDELVRDLEGVARRRPWMLASLGVIGGFALSRFLKASSENRYAIRTGYHGGGHREGAYTQTGGYGYSSGPEVGYSTQPTSGGYASTRRSTIDEEHEDALASAPSTRESEEVDRGHDESRL